VTLGLAERQEVLGAPVDGFCGGRLDDTVFGLLHRERDRLFPDEMFADLFMSRGRRSVPPSIVASVLVLKQLEGLSDVEAIDRFNSDVRWRHACGVGGWEQGLVGFDRTVLARFRMRLEATVGSLGAVGVRWEDRSGLATSAAVSACCRSPAGSAASGTGGGPLAGWHLPRGLA